MGMNLSRLEDSSEFECSNCKWGIIISSASKATISQFIEWLKIEDYEDDGIDYFPGFEIN